MNAPVPVPVATRVRPYLRLIGFSAIAVGLFVTLLLAATIWRWWTTFDYVQTEGQAGAVRHYSEARSKGRQRQRTAYVYEYQAGGMQFSVAADAAGSPVEEGQPIAVWVDPLRPDKSVLTREFEQVWLFLLPLAAFLTTKGVAALFGRSDLGTAPARAHCVRADPDSYGVWWTAALMVTLFGLPLTAIAAVSYTRGDDPRAILAVAILPLAGALLAVAARRRQLARKGLGKLVLDVWPSPAGELKARVHFQPALAARSGAQVEQVLVQIEVAQVQRVARGRSVEAKVVWAHRIEAMLARGSGHADFRVAIPDWPVPFENVEAACWKISVMALGATAHFRLAPDIIRGGPASTT